MTFDLWGQNVNSKLIYLQNRYRYLNNSFSGFFFDNARKFFLKWLLTSEVKLGLWGQNVNFKLIYLQNRYRYLHNSFWLLFDNICKVFPKWLLTSKVKNGLWRKKLSILFSIIITQPLSVNQDSKYHHTIFYFSSLFFIFIFII